MGSEKQERKDTEEIETPEPLSRRYARVVFDRGRWWCQAGVIGMFVATFACFLAPIYYRFELATHFVAFYFGATLVAAFVLALARRWAWMGGAIALAAFHGVSVLTWYVPAGPARSERAAPISIMTANVHTENTDHAAFVKLIQSTKPDVLAIEEVNKEWRRDLAPLHELYPFRVERSRDDNFGIALFSRLPLSDSRVFELANSEIPAIEATVTAGKAGVHLLCIHTLPPISEEYANIRNAMLGAIADRLIQHQGPRIVCGDFNCALWSPYYKSLVRKTGMKNSRQGFGVLPTWPAGLGPFMIPLDHCLVSADITVTNCLVGPDFGSDHRPLLTKLVINE